MVNVQCTDQSDNHYSSTTGSCKINRTIYIRYISDDVTLNINYRRHSNTHFIISYLSLYLSIIVLQWIRQATWAAYLLIKYHIKKLATK